MTPVKCPSQDWDKHIAEEEEVLERSDKQYRVVCFMRIEVGEFEREPQSYEDAQAEVEHLKCVFPFPK